MEVLMILTSHDRPGNTGRKTGFWLEEDAGTQITLASQGRSPTARSQE
jgi:hypothetical protein